MTARQPLTRSAVETVLMRVVECPPRVGTYDHARWHRDILLLAWVLHHPRRTPELPFITWKPDNSGHAYLSENSRWMYRDIKSTVDPMRASYRLATPVAEVLTAYLDGARNKLVKAESDSLFSMQSGHLQYRLLTLIERYYGKEVGMAEVLALQGDSPSTGIRKGVTGN